MRITLVVAAFVFACAEPPPAAYVATPNWTPVQNPHDPNNTGAAVQAPLVIAGMVAHEVRRAHDDNEADLWYATDVHVDLERVRWRPCDDQGHCFAEVEHAPIGDLLGVDAVADAGPELKLLRFRAASETYERLQFRERRQSATER